MSRETTALHEAGHCLLGLLRDRLIDQVTISEEYNNEWGGLVTWLPLQSAQSPQELARDHLMIATAGWCATHPSMDAMELLVRIPLDGVDYQFAFAQLEVLAPSTKRRLIVWSALVTEVKRLLQDFQRPLNVLSKAIYERQQMTGQEVLELLQDEDLWPSIRTRVPRTLASRSRYPHHTRF
jgi:hypothetical protein